MSPFGLVSSLSRPIENATGVTLFSSTLMAKREHALDLGRLIGAASAGSKRLSRSLAGGCYTL